MPKNETTGRPTKYRPEYDEQARKLCLKGFTDKEMADFFGVVESTIHKWKHDFPSFSESLKAGKTYCDEDVVRSLYERAMGYSHPETKVFNNQGEIITHEVIKHYPPDTTAQIFWLKNRRPEEWRDKPEGQQVEEAIIQKVQIEVVGANQDNRD